MDFSNIQCAKLVLRILPGDVPCATKLHVSVAIILLHCSTVDIAIDGCGGCATNRCKEKSCLRKEKSCLECANKLSMNRFSPQMKQCNVIG